MRYEQNIALIWDAASHVWLGFYRPREVIRVADPVQVRPSLERIEALVTGEGLYAAGFVTYEAAPAFDAALPVRPRARDDFPLLWFGIYEQMVLVPPGFWSWTGEPASPSPAWSPSISEQGYTQALGRIREHLRVGDSYQVNFTFRLRAGFNDHPWDFFHRLCKGSPPPHAAYVRLPDWAVCSFSPELFFVLEGGEIVSKPMKGTRARGRTLEQDVALAEELQNSAKDRAENVMITDMVRNDLGRIAVPGSVKVEDLCTVEKHATVWQMISTVRARTHGSLAEIFTAMFPPASITGAPKTASMGIIADLESDPRHIYTGSIGYMGPAEPMTLQSSCTGRGRRAVFNVAIRTVLVDERRSQAEYGVGGGIVWDSDEQGEYEECRVKAEILRRGSPAFSLLETMLWSPDRGIVLLNRHLARLRSSAMYFDYDMDMERIRGQLDELIAGLPPAPRMIRLILNKLGKTILEHLPPPAPPAERLRVVVASSPVDSGDVFLYHKTTHREMYAKALAAHPGYDDVLLINERGELTESTRANLAVMLEGVLYTPPVRCGLLNGTLRAEMLDQGRLQERILRPEELFRAQQVLLLNSVRGVHDVDVLPSGQDHR